MSDSVEFTSINRGQMATKKRFIPNVPVKNHLGEELSFYDDLVKDKIVLLHLMSIHHESKYRVAKNISRFQSAISSNVLNAKVGKEIHIYSISIDPQADSVERLRLFARKCRAGRGWQFLTGPMESIEAIRATLFAHSGIVTEPDPQKVQPPKDALQDCSMGLLRYGNDRLGLWGSVPGKAEPAMVAERVSWLLSNPKQTMKLSRRGPFPNRQFQV